MQAPAPALALKQRHRDVLTAALSTHAAAAPPWHVLVADEPAHAMLTALFTPAELRAFGVTLVHRLHAGGARAPVPHVPAHFVVAPTAENVAHVARDLAGPAPRYAAAHVSFTTAVAPPLLAALAAQLPLPSPLARVRDLHAAFLALQPRLFSLQAPRAYPAAAAAAAAAAAGDGAAGEARLRALVDPLVDGLFSVCLTLGVVPVVRAQRAGPAEAVAAALDARLRDGLPLFARAPTRARAFKRPLLLLLDRDLDHAPMLHHAWTYQALAHDCLPMRANELTLPPPASSSSSGSRSAAASQTQKPRVYSVDPEKDEFWRRHAAAPFPHVAEAVEAALARYRADVERLNTRASERPPDGDEDDKNARAPAPAPANSDPGRLADAIASLPDLARQKEAIDKHTNIATALLAQIGARALDAFFDLESQLLAGPAPGTAQAAAAFKPAVLELVRTGAAAGAGGSGGGADNDDDDPTGAAEGGEGMLKQKKRGAVRAGTPADRLRLFLIYYERFGQALSEEDMVEFREALAGAGADLPIVDYIGRKRGFRHDAAPPRAGGIGTAAAPLAAAAAAAASLNAASLNAGKLRGFMRSVVTSGVRGIAGVAQSAKQLVVRPRSPFAAARTLELFMSESARDAAGAGAADVLDGFLLFDPKLAPTGGKVIADGMAGGRPGAHRQVFSDAIVFVVGGGNYVEFDDCMRIADAHPSERNVLYGATDMLTPDEFVKQLATVAALPQ